MIKRLVQFGLLLLVLNEVRGVIMSIPVLYGMIKYMGDEWALILGASYLVGLALSVWIPIIAYRKLKSKLAKDENGGKQ